MRKLIETTAALASLALSSIASTTAAYGGQTLDHVLSTKTLTVAVGTDGGKMSVLNDQQEKFVTPGWDMSIAGKWQGAGI